MVAVPQMPASVSLAYSVMVEIAFVANPYGTLSWTDVSQYVTEIQTKRGKNVDLGTPEAGTAAVTLWNIDGRFNPGDPLSPYSSNVLPRRPIRITVISGATFNVWRGFVNSWPQTYSMGGAYTQVILSCNDAFTNVLDAKFGPRFQDVVGTDLGLGTTGAYFPMVNLITGAPIGTATADSYKFGDSNVPGAGVTIGTGTLTAGSLAGRASDYFLRVTKAAAQQIQVQARTSPTNLAANPNSMEFFLRIHVKDTNTTRPSYMLMNDDTTAAYAFGASNVFLVHSATATSGYKLVLGAATGTASSTTLGSTVATYGDLALDAIYHIAFIAVVGGTGGYQLYVNGALWYDGSADTAYHFGGSILFTNDAAISPASVVLDIDEIIFYTVAPQNPPVAGQLTPTMVKSHYALSGVAGTAAVADYPSQTTGVRAGAILDTLMWPAGDRVIDTGLSTLSASGSVNGKTALSLLIEAAASELGNAFVDGQGRVVFQDRAHRTGALVAMTLGDGTGEVGYLGDVKIEYDAIRIFNDVTISQSTGTLPVSSIRLDATSQTAYGVQSYSGSFPLNTPADCDGMADTLIARYKDPHQRVEHVSIDLTSNPLLVPIVLAREIGDLIRFRRRPQGALSPLDMNNTLQGIEIHFIAYPREFRVTLNLDPASPNATY